MRKGFMLVIGLLTVGGCKTESTVSLSSQNCFEACLDASVGVNLQAHLALATHLRDSLELARGGLTVYANTAHALTGFVQSIVELAPGMPGGLVYAGDGSFTAQPNPSTRVELRFYLASDTSFGAAGDLIPFNLFDVANYFRGLGVGVKTSIGLGGISTTTQFAFDELGPGAELLGIDANATSPIDVNLGAFSSQLTRVVIGARIVENATADSATIDYTLTPAPLAASAVGGQPIALGFSDFRVRNDAMEQALSLESAPLSMLGAGPIYDGSVQALSSSPDFAFRLLIDYDLSAAADITLGCVDASLRIP